ncbi:chemotaxis protein CheW [Priestia filamentosa]|uniref:chemotaxis protein CheW n=1 Tax=Priestia filamentosa TaxID=1402861 RepID=UPI00397C95FE
MKKKGPKFLVFYTSEEQFAINIRDIVIIEKVDYQGENQYDKRIKKVNSYPDYIEGIFSYKNRIIPVIEFEYFLSQKKMKRHSENKIIIIKGKNIDYGILVNDVQSIIELKLDTFIQLYKEFPLHMTEKHGEVYIIPDLEDMLNHQHIKEVFKNIQGNQSK